jgi:hypothetical protein
MKAKPSWPLWLVCLAFYSLLDEALTALLHGAFKWSQLPGAIEGAIVGATLTWLWALRRWYKSEDGF